MRRAPLIVLLAMLLFGSLALPAASAADHPLAAASKKCKKKHRGKRYRCEKGPAKPPVSPPAVTQARISISPTLRDFGAPPPFGKSTRTFVIANSGGSLSGVPVPVITGLNSDSFSLGSNSCTVPLGPGAACQVDVDLFPRGAGVVSALLNVTAVPGGTASAGMAGDIQA
jgi:hypothetical protein